MRDGASVPGRRATTGLLPAALVLLAVAAIGQVPPPQGLVTDRAGVIDAPVQRQITQAIEELKQKTGAEIAVLTVDSTAPLDDFTYAMQVAEAWKPGQAREHSGVLVLVAVKDRKVRILTGYGVEGVLPDGLVGEIQDREMVPEFRAGRFGEGILRGVSAIARRIAAERGVELSGAPAGQARPARGETQIPLWVIALGVVVLILVLSQAGSRTGGVQRRRGGGPIIIPGGFGGGGRGGFPGGFGGGGGGFGGFGGGGFGGGGAGRSW